MGFLEKVFSTDFLAASGLTFALTIVSMLLGVAGGLVLALAKASPVPPLRWVVDGYIWVFRGTPVLLQLIFVFNVLPLWGLNFSPFTCAVVALSLNEAAYMAEIVRGGLLGVDRGQRTAARMLGMSEAKITRWVVLPQAARLILPPTGNQFIGMLKTSALASVVSVQDLLLTAQRQAAADFDYVSALGAAAAHYLVLTTVFTFAAATLERRLDITRRAAARRRTPVGATAVVNAT
ncbi:amino acid ABC transporter permease [Saccharopolyspora phatthalungensis]|uniref:Polar amino acid transport system permease protein n=1 Tax=Saccharopolyspora phatthalungensis TaxID=664693 RepID=A0A840QI09_9PSEU|nr:amino acid ABC transporter permease [Saccharopolyspora phatthalungensis]MBB5158309.1 polar amino acid transport system permease protein [Saccharopolyspora phatthalungensis]